MECNSTRQTKIFQTKLCTWISCSFNKGTAMCWKRVLQLFQEQGLFLGRQWARTHHKIVPHIRQPRRCNSNAPKTIVTMQTKSKSRIWSINTDTIRTRTQNTIELKNIGHVTQKYILWGHGPSLINHVVKQSYCQSTKIVVMNILDSQIIGWKLFSLVDSFAGWPGWKAPLLTCLFWVLICIFLLHWNVAPLRQRGCTCWLHSDDQVGGGLQKVICFSLVFINNIPLPEVSSSFYNYSRNNFRSREYNLN